MALRVHVVIQVMTIAIRAEEVWPIEAILADHDNPEGPLHRWREGALSDAPEIEVDEVLADPSWRWLNVDLPANFEHGYIASWKGDVKWVRGTPPAIPAWMPKWTIAIPDPDVWRECRSPAEAEDRERARNLGRLTAPRRAQLSRPYHPRMDIPADFLRFVTQAAEDAVTFDGDAATIASRAQEGDKDAVAELTRAYAANAVLTGIRLRPSWLPMPDAAQEAMLVLGRLIGEGSAAIAVELPAAIEATFAGFRKPPDTA